MNSPAIPNQANTVATFSSIQYFCLCLLAITLPLVEAPKNIAYILLIVVWVFRLCMLGTRGIRFCAYDWIFAIFISGNLLTSFGAYLKGASICDPRDILRYSLVGWMLLHTELSRKQICTLLLLLLGSALIGVGWSYWDLSRGRIQDFELHSVGHVNHSSIYILLIIGGVLAYLSQIQWGWWKSLALAAVLLLLCSVLLETESRATMVGLIFMVAVFMAVVAYHHKRLAAVCLIAIAIIVGFAVKEPPQVYYKFISNAQTFKNHLTPRERIWNVALLVWKKEPIFGLGYRSYRTINQQKMQELYKDSGHNFEDESLYFFSSHAHNRFINSLVEGGLVGIASLLFFLLAVGFVLWRHRAALRQPGEQLSAWLLGFYTLLINILVGLFNTTLHHEHAILSTMLLVLSYKQLLMAGRR